MKVTTNQPNTTYTLYDVGDGQAFLINKVWYLLVYNGDDDRYLTPLAVALGYANGVDVSGCQPDIKLEWSTRVEAIGNVSINIERVK